MSLIISLNFPSYVRCLLEQGGLFESNITMVFMVTRSEILNVQLTAEIYENRREYNRRHSQDSEVILSEYTGIAWLDQEMALDRECAACFWFDTLILKILMRVNMV